MTKPNTLRIIQIVAALFCISKLALDLFIVLYDYPSIYAALFGETINSGFLPNSIKLGIIAESILLSLPIGIIAAFNFTKTDLDSKRGNITLLTSGLLFIANYFASIFADRGITWIISRKYSSKTLALFSSINSVRSFYGFLIIASFVMVCCCAAVEVYGGKNASKNAYKKAA